MDGRPVVWETHNRRHIEEDHAERSISTDEVEQAMNDPQRWERTVERDGDLYRTVIGRTSAGRFLFVAYVEVPDGRLPVHARQASRTLIERYYGGEAEH